MTKYKYTNAIVHAQRRADREDRQIFVWYREYDDTYLTAPAHMTNFPVAIHIASVDSEDIIWEREKWSG
jgi:hypothetical protein